MKKPAVHERSPLLVPALVVLTALLAIYLSLRARDAGSERPAGKPAPGATLSVFFTSELAGYREPCG